MTDTVVFVGKFVASGCLRGTRDCFDGISEEVDFFVAESLELCVVLGACDDYSARCAGTGTGFIAYLIS